jgi:anti-anti-sigma factor
MTISRTSSAQALTVATAYYCDDTLVVRATGEIDLTTVPLLARAVGGDRPMDVVFDFSKVTFLGCCGLTVLAAAADRVRGTDAGVSVVVANPAVHRALAVLDRPAVRTYRQLSQALRAVRTVPDAGPRVLSVPRPRAAGDAGVGASQARHTRTISTISTGTPP